MEMENKPMEQPMQPQAAVAKAIGPEQLQKFMQILQDYKTGKARTENRIVPRGIRPFRNIFPCSFLRL